MRTLVTGGAGFIGSHLAERLLADGHDVRILDDLSTGRREHVPAGAQLVEGDVSDAVAVRKAVEGVDVVFHEAALGSVVQSLDDPARTDVVNVHGSILVLSASRDAGVRRVVTASSCSVYGDGREAPLTEDDPPRPLSPYAVTKLTLEHYCRVFTETFGLETVALRYFNVYGPRQASDAAYAAVVPLFVDAVRSGRAPVVYGDGQQTRDFVFVDDVVQANLLAARAPASACAGRAVNVASGRSTSVHEVLEEISGAVGTEPTCTHAEARVGEVRHSRAEVALAVRAIGFRAEMSLRDGIRRTVAAATTS